MLFESNLVRYVQKCVVLLQYSHSMNQTSRAEKRKEKQKMYTVTFSNEELEEMKANDAVVIVSCDDDNGHRLY